MLTRARTLGLVVALAATQLSGCYGGSEPYYQDDYYGDAYCAPGIDQSELDTGGTLDLEPGYGAGVTAEYLGDGAWRFASACDTALSGYPCRWDLLVTAVDGTIFDFAPESLERNDVLDWSTGFDGAEAEAARLIATSDYDLDAFTLEATPGATLEVDVLLDDQCGGAFLHWLHDGYVYRAETQAVDLTPSAP